LAAKLIGIKFSHKRKIELFETISEKKINTSHKIFSLTPDAVEMD
jgi:hypothetical protein